MVTLAFYLWQTFVYVNKIFHAKVGMVDIFILHIHVACPTGDTVIVCIHPQSKNWDMNVSSRRL